jgi:hypothetical protein
MDWIALAVIGTFGLVFLTILILGILIYVKVSKRTKIRCTVFLKTGSQKSVDIKREDNKFSLFGKEYIVNEVAVVKTVMRDYLYYLEDNPTAIIYDFKDKKPSIPADDLKTILDNDLITKLFNLEIFDTIKLLLIIIVVALVIVIGLLVWIKSTDVQLKNSAENFNLIVNATRYAITGGVV